MSSDQWSIAAMYLVTIVLVLAAVWWGGRRLLAVSRRSKDGKAPASETGTGRDRDTPS